MVLTSNIWTDVGLHNSARGKVIDFVYTNLSGPINGDIIEAVVVKFWELDAQFVPFIPNYPNIVAIPAIQAEWKPNVQNLIHKHFPIMIY